MPRTAATRQSTEGENDVVKYARSYVTDKVNFWQGKLQELNSGSYNGVASSVNMGRASNGASDEPAPRKRRRMSAEARKRISEATKARWARTRKEQEDKTAAAAARAAKGGKRKGAKRGRPRKNAPTAAAATE